MQISKHRAAQPYLGVIEKTSALFDGNDAKNALQFGKTVLEVGSVAVPIATVMAQGISMAAQKMTEASRKATAYKTMLQQNPHLMDPTVDPDLTQRYFNTLYRLNPELATDPTVAASFVNNAVRTNNPAMPHAGLFEHARQLADLKSKSRMSSSFGKDLSAEMVNLGKMIRTDRSQELMGRMDAQAEKHREEMAGMKVDMRIQHQAHQKELRDRERMQRVMEMMRRRGPVRP